MVWLVLVFVCNELSYGTVPVAGQCPVSSCAVSLSGSEESLQFSLEEQDHILETMNQNMFSAFEKLEAAVNRINARGQEELCQDLKTLHYNMSVNLESLSEKIPARFECHTTQEQEECLRFLNLSLISMTVRTEELIQAVNESLFSALQAVSRSLDEKIQVMQVQLQSQSSTLQTVNRSLDEKFQVMRVQLQSQSSALQTVNRSLDEKFQVMQGQLQSQYSTLQTVNRSLDEKFQVMNVSVVSALRELDQKLQTMNETLSSSIDKINDKLNTTFDHVNEALQYLRRQDHCRNTSDVCDCSDIKANGHTTSEVYRTYVVDEGQRYYADVFCDMTTTNGPWTAFQRREDGSEDFYRGWNEYANGFGNPSGEFWLGNNFLHLLTSKRRYRLRIDMEDFEGGKRYAEYSTFNISSSADKYKLRVGGFSGNTEDGLAYANYRRFSTKDNDNDARDTLNCAVNRRGAWWYNLCPYSTNSVGNCEATNSRSMSYTSCHYSNLNGLYLRGNYSSSGSLNGYEGIHWYPWRWQWYSLKTTEMKISAS